MVVVRVVRRAARRCASSTAFDPVPCRILRRPESKPFTFDGRLWLISGVAGLIGLGYLTRSRNRSRNTQSWAKGGATHSVAAATTASIVSSHRDRPLRLEAAVTGSVGEVGRGMGDPKRHPARRLLAVGLVVLAICAAAALGAFVGDRWSGHRQAAPGATAPAGSRPALPATTTGIAPKSANPAVSTIAPTAARASTSTAANAARPAASTTRAAAPASPTAGVAPAGRLFGWVAVKNARAYTVKFTRNGKTVYSATTSVSQIRVPASWRRGGRRMTLSPGTYRWYVWPVYRGVTTKQTISAAIVASKLTVP